ncbi:MAG TPA: FADH(2)-oxidizing methylenetetrahydrofolate--tRNA-(uracil(54)-C(5))-methyltransferase TrmFO [Megamonas hypermegale]|uniref:FADH(2)-oxidizing methylenetetrahydrofolate--tRNA-(uracil(54)-C(5))- methyltransferase TrmFO n=1 Tax=Megamonas hypermegale TaxID=158847 RepID=UPI001DAC4000|nr:FADH(2)-oxidizing methylenetetrahydrofolate--tRNA-(uracil(54)-C(5))-methyltransferase TrmFO [Megamonas hypermegale]HJG07960.1 FADH(2)-oxidizing methylenetetrahydrofolate--tRNA-(uracil(54)-C(5))-methyltransferase TrmFO [Megamonas hypermegale]
MKKVIIVGAGMAGSEAAWQVANRGIKVDLYEMRPVKSTPAHKTDKFAELVCSNSLRGAGLENAVGLLKEEMRRLKSLIMESADINRVPAGGALAVDREGFSQYITDKVKNHPNITVINEEIAQIPTEEDAITIIASGPLTSEVLAKSIKELTGQEYFYFYDAAAPLIAKESIDMSKAYRASRYGKGTADYINCAMDKEQYEHFWHELVNAEMAPIKEFEKAKFFEGCMPVEEMARRGEDTLLFGPLKPVGLEDPRTGKRPYAVVQLRQDNVADSLYNIVGFQTHLKWPEQKRVFGLIPGLENAEFVRYGVMHRNTFINSPELLRPTLQFYNRDDLLFAGQMTGVEGYVESAASGLVAGINAAYLAQGQEPVIFPKETAHGSMCNYITSAVAKHFQPMNANFGLMPPLEERIRDKKLKKQKIAQRALEFLDKFSADVLKINKEN